MTTITASSNANLVDPSVVQIENGKWVAVVNVSSYLKPHPEDERIPTTELPLTVPAKWWAQVLGVRADEIVMHLTSERRTTPKDYGYVSIEQTWQLVADNPFVVVHFSDDEQNFWHGKNANMRRWFRTARQMHKGELGRKPDLIRTPKLLPSDIPDPDNGHWDNSNPNDPKYIRPNLNWVELSELSGIVGLSVEKIIRGFAGFSVTNYGELNVPLLRGMLRREDIVRVYIGDVPKSFCGGEYYWGGNNALPLNQMQQVIDRNDGRVWVPQSFAYTVMRLMQFGYRPENETPENSFRFEAPMPVAPQSKLPMLSVEALRELHQLRVSLAEELPKVTFKWMAEIALEADRWQNAPQMSDTSQGFSYYTNFEILDFDSENGYIAIANGYWTRAGASKSNNYYCGMLAVFPRRVENPRQDPSAILRLWFFPGEVVRMTPTGSKGGLCPPEVSADLAERVKRFLAGLGYSI